MSEKLVTAVLIAMATDRGLDVKEQTAFYKVTSPTKNRKAIYIAKSKKTVTRIDMAGFEPEEHPAVRVLTKEDAKNLNLGAVRGQILTKDLSEDVTEDLVIEAYEAALAVLQDEAPGFKLGRERGESTEEDEQNAVETQPAEEVEQVAAEQ